MHMRCDSLVRSFIHEMSTAALGPQCASAALRLFASLVFLCSGGSVMIPPVNWPFSMEVPRLVFLLGFMDYLEQIYPESSLKMHIPYPTPHLAVEPKNHDCY